MKIYTKTGDTGSTSLVGGARVDKSCTQLEAYGTIDELNAVLGTALEELLAAQVQIPRQTLRHNLAQQLLTLQNRLFSIGGIVATAPDNRNHYWNNVPIAEWTTNIESLIDDYSAQLPDIQNFILPSGSKSAAQLHVARTVARRAERQICKLNDNHPSNDQTMTAVTAFVNRLSDFLFVAARYALFLEDKKETYWTAESD